MSDERAVKPRRKAKATKTQTFAERAQAYAPLASILAVVISVGSLALALRVQAEAEARARGQAQIYFEMGTPANCTVPEDQLKVLCKLVTKPADPSMRVLQSIVQYPASEFPDGSRRYSEYYAPPEIYLSDRAPFFAARTQRIHGPKKNKEVSSGVIPITIWSYYQYGGKKYYDVSAYHLFYMVENYEGRAVVVPGQLAYCGRLPTWPTFLIDPWLPTNVGFPDEKSTAAVFECMGTAMTFEMEPGRHTITTDLAADVQAKPPPYGTFPTRVRSFTSKPIGRAGRIESYRMMLR